MDIQGRIALVTGGAAGLGREIALGLAGAGADVVVADLDGSGAEETGALVRDRGRRAWPITVDLRDDDQVSGLIERAALQGGPHILVNNAGGWTPGGDQYPDASLEQWSATLAFNLRAPMLLTQLCLGPMQKAGGGVVVNISASGGVGFEGYGSPEYGASKAGLIRLTACLSDLLERHLVRAACIVPGWIGLDRAHDEVAAMPDGERAALPPLIPPTEVVQVVLDLVNDDSRSGSVVELRGGTPPRPMSS